MEELMERTESATLRERWDAFRAEQPKVRRRDAADALGVSEAELIASECGDGVTRLTGDWRKLIPEFESLGKVMALTRNPYIVHETTGIYRNTSFEHPHVGMVLGEGIDLRLFMQSWDSAFALREETSNGTRRSIQFFNRQGTALHKVYLKNDEGVDTFENLVERWKSDDQSPEQMVERVEEREEERPDGEIDVDGLRSHWSGMTDTHEFFGMLRTFGVTRTQALRLAGKEFACRVAPDAYRAVLQQAAGTETPIMIFVGNGGCMQIFTGKVRRLVEVHGWYNVLDPGFNLHMREEGVDSAWIVCKPTSDGFVTSLELYDADGNNLALFFGSRKESIVENPAWTEIIAGIPVED